MYSGVMSIDRVRCNVVGANLKPQYLFLETSSAKALAKRTRKSTKFFDLRSTPFRLATHSRGLAMSCVDFGGAQIRSPVDASFSPFGRPSLVDAS